MALLGERKAFDTDTFAFVTAASLVIIQVIGLIIDKMFSLQIRLGPAFVLLGYLAAVWLAIGIARSVNKGLAVQKSEFLMFIVVSAVVITMALLLPAYLPEIFKEGTRGIQSAIGFP